MVCRCSMRPPQLQPERRFHFHPLWLRTEPLPCFFPRLEVVWEIRRQGGLLKHLIAETPHGEYDEARDFWRPYSRSICALFVCLGWFFMAFGVIRGPVCC
jgi:hypothetical protein